MSAIYDLLTKPDPAQVAKMTHPIPKARLVERELYILVQCKDKVVLDIGATGPMHEAILQVAKKCYGMDIIEKSEDNYFRVDLDKAVSLPVLNDLEVVIAGEVLEHLSNAGHFLDLLKPYKCPIVITTPNAFSEVGAYHVKRGIEHVNKEHVSYYSFQTLSVLVERHGYKMLDWCWYNGKPEKPQLAEGLVCLIS
jgi:2-polyprenyl-3-methyl-5-hydroxy-6-metoxy-1,4-benzoquinol methylase